MEEPRVPQGLHLEQKIGFVLLLIFCILVVGMGFLQLRNTIYGPFVFRPSPATDDATEALFANEEVRLQSIDTDQDGLNNYEELYFYQTSPYLPDTDSDKIGDKQEIDQGTDPLCPEGKSCAQNLATSVLVTTSTLPPPPEPPKELTGFSGSAVSGSAAPSDILSSQNVENVFSDPARVRELLLQYGGISPEQLSQIPDSVLLQYAREVLSTQQLTAPEDSPAAPKNEEF